MMKQTTTPNTTKSQTTVNKEAFKMLAMEIGLNAACRRLGIPIPTGKSWARRGKWKLPKRTGGRPGRSLATSQLDANRDANQMPIANALAQTHEELEQRGKGAVARAAVKSAEAFEKLPIPHPQALQQLASALGRVFQWSSGGGNTVNVHAEKAVIVCDEGRRNELIEQRQRLLETEKPATGRTIEAAVPVTLPKQQTEANASVDEGNVPTERAKSPHSAQ
jgi:hypothetical protein